MIELPEAITLGHQIDEALAGKTVTDVFNATSLHKFAFFNGDPLNYKTLLSKNTYALPCPKCQGSIQKESFMGGAI